MAENPSALYQVVESLAIRARLKQWSSKAIELGIYDEYIAALKVIARKLETDPVGWGDPNYRLYNLDLLVCHGIHSFLHVRYAVDEGRKIVYVTEISPLSDHPLSRES